jgi:hypothetical protein
MVARALEAGSPRRDCAGHEIRFSHSDLPPAAAAVRIGTSIQQDARRLPPEDCAPAGGLSARPARASPVKGRVLCTEDL